jgi:hypothetical protein
MRRRHSASSSHRCRAPASAPAASTRSAQSLLGQRPTLLCCGWRGPLLQPRAEPSSSRSSGERRVQSHTPVRRWAVRSEPKTSSIGTAVVMTNESSDAGASPQRATVSHGGNNKTETPVSHGRTRRASPRPRPRTQSHRLRSSREKEKTACRSARRATKSVTRGKLVTHTFGQVKQKCSRPR